MPTSKKAIKQTPARTVNGVGRKPRSKERPKLERHNDDAPVIDESLAAFKLYVAPSKIHRWGIYAGERIPPRRKIIEYTGERVSRRETKRRAEGPLNYLFTLDSYWCIDGSVGGSGAQYINHCCDPNVYAVILKGHILYMANRWIEKGEELTIDYHFAADVEQYPCACGAANCRGTINLKK
jgi:SET domain-containing protein